MNLNIRHNVEALGSYAHLCWSIACDIFRHGVERKEFFRQLVKIGRDSLPIVLITAIFTGMVLALQTAYGLQRFGAKNYVGNIVGLALVRELGPVLSAIMVCGRIGAGIAAEIGSMVVTEQVDAIRALGADPIRKLVSPRVLAAVIALPALVVFADILGIYGGLVVATLELNLGMHTYYRSVMYTVVVRDAVDGLIKASFFGFLIVTIACFKGLRTRGGTEGVGLSTTDAVVTGSLVIFVADFFITKALLMLG